MLRFLSLATLLLISCAASFAQESQTPVARGAQANPCASATTQAELNKCSGEEHLKADEHLNSVYKNLLRMLQQSADDSKKQKDDGLTKQAETAIQKLRAAQSAWDQYRTLHCGAVKQQFEGGTIAPLEWATCMTETANHRIAELKSGYEIGDRKLE
jgi:uncharacterized protein YecT (DUF1311 family)